MTIFYCKHCKDPVSDAHCKTCTGIMGYNIVRKTACQECHDELVHGIVHLETPVHIAGNTVPGVVCGDEGYEANAVRDMEDAPGALEEAR